MATPKTTSQITFDSWTTIQMSLTSGNQFTDTAPSDDVGGKALVFEQGIWKYPKQDSGGQIVVSGNGLARPVRLVNIMANFGASTAFTVHVAQGAANTSGEPYDAGDASLYDTGDIQVHSGTAQYLAENLDAADAGIGVVVWPGQKVYVTTAAAVEPVIRLTFSQGVERD